MILLIISINFILSHKKLKASLKVGSNEHTHSNTFIIYIQIRRVRFLVTCRLFVGFYSAYDLTVICKKISLEIKCQININHILIYDPSCDTSVATAPLGLVWKSNVLDNFSMICKQ